MISIPLLRNLSPCTWPQDCVMSLGSDCWAAQLRGDPTGRGYQQSPRGVFMSLLELQVNSWSLSWHFLVWLGLQSQVSELLMQRPGYWLNPCSVSVEAPWSSLWHCRQNGHFWIPSAGHCHQHLEDWRSFRAIFSFPRAAWNQNSPIRSRLCLELQPDEWKSDGLPVALC